MFTPILSPTMKWNRLESNTVLRSSSWWPRAAFKALHLYALFRAEGIRRGGGARDAKGALKVSLYGVKLFRHFVHGFSQHIKTYYLSSWTKNTHIEVRNSELKFVKFVERKGRRIWSCFNQINIVFLSKTAIILNHSMTPDLWEKKCNYCMI